MTDSATVQLNSFIEKLKKSTMKSIQKSYNGGGGGITKTRMSIKRKGTMTLWHESAALANEIDQQPMEIAYKDKTTRSTV